jgi:hypothetical protein
MPQARVLSKPFHLRDLVAEVDRLFEMDNVTGLQWTLPSTRARWWSVRQLGLASDWPERDKSDSYFRGRWVDYLILGADGKPLDARTAIENGRVTLHSRSGRPRSGGSGSRGRNPDYAAAFDAIFERLDSPSAAIERVLLDSTPARAFPERERVLATAADLAADTPTTVRTRMRAKMRSFGRLDSMPANEGNQNKKVRIDTSLHAEGS